MLPDFLGFFRHWWDPVKGLYTDTRSTKEKVKGETARSCQCCGSIFGSPEINRHFLHVFRDACFGLGVNQKAS